jgi:hypothetical protein
MVHSFQGCALVKHGKQLARWVVSSFHAKADHRRNAIPGGVGFVSWEGIPLNSEAAK